MPRAGREPKKHSVHGALRPDPAHGRESEVEAEGPRIIISFFVPGVPRPQGSKKAFPHSKTGRIVVIDDCAKGKDWKHTVACFARKAYSGAPLQGAVSLDCVFQVMRPKAHFGKYNLRSSAPMFPTVKPDRTKLLRAVEDALTGIVWRDDAQVVDGRVVKVYASRPGVEIMVTELPGSTRQASVGLNRKETYDE